MNDHVVLTINGRVVYESDIGSRPTPTPTPVPIPVPTDYSRYALYAGDTRVMLESPYRFGKYPGPLWPSWWNWDDAYASGYILREVPEDSAPDPHLNRDLTGTNGNVLKTEGPAGHTAVFQLREMAGKRVRIKAFRIPSILGACERLQITVQGRTTQGGGSDAQATTEIVSTGNDPVTLTLHQAGGAGIQIGPA